MCVVEGRRLGGGALRRPPFRWWWWCVCLRVCALPPPLLVWTLGAPTIGIAGGLTAIKTELNDRSQV